MSTRSRAEPFVLGACAALSGACGLVYEVVWVKQLGLWLGQTTLAVSLVVAAFLGGLVIGSVTIGPRADRSTRPLMLFAALELGTGVLAVLVTMFLGRASELSSRWGLPGGGPLPMRVLLGFLAVLGPTLLMGGTLPALTRFVAREADRMGRSFAFVYSANTLGASIGCALAGFVAIGRLGLLRTALLAAAGDVAVAALAFAFGRAPSPPAAEEDANPHALPRRDRTVLIALFAACGFGSISYEILWFRVLSNFLEASAYTFTLLLSVFLLGLVLGASWFASRLSARGRLLETFAAIELLLAFAGLLSVALLGPSRALERFLPQALAHAGLARSGYVAMFLHAGLVILGPTTLIGVAFPLVAQLTTERVRTVGSRVALLYSVNTLGGIVGSLAMGLWLIPALGTQRCFGIVCLVNAATAIAAARLSRDSGAKERTAIVLGAGALLIALVALPGDYLLTALSAYRDSKLLAVREGKDGTLAVLEYNHDTICRSGLYDCDARCEAPFSHRQLVFGSISYASTVLPAKRYMRTLAHLPLLLRPDAKDVLEICFGTGTTAGSFLRHGSVSSLTMVDLNADVFDFAPHFADSNHGVLTDPRAHPIVDDGRHFLATTDRRFDVVSLEPPPPSALGAVALYSREFYAAAKARLSPGGVVAQWIPLDQQSDQLSRMLLRSMADEFAHVQLWVPTRLEGVVLGSDAPLSVDATSWRARWLEPAVRADLDEVGFARPEALWGTFAMEDEALRRYVAAVPPVTDDQPAIEYFLSQSARPFSARALLEAAEAPDALFGSSADAALRTDLGSQQKARDRFIEAYVASHDHDLPLARAQLEEAVRWAGPNAYSDYLSSLEYGCMARAH